MGHRSGLQTPALLCRSRHLRSPDVSVSVAAKTFYCWENHWNSNFLQASMIYFHTSIKKKKYLSWHVLGHCDYDMMAQLGTWKCMFTRHRQSHFRLFSCSDSQVSIKKLPSWLHVGTMLNHLLHQFLPAGQGENFVHANIVRQIPPSHPENARKINAIMQPLAAQVTALVSVSR